MKTMGKKSIEKTVIVTGGTQGIGSFIARKFHQAGWFVTVASRKPMDLVDQLGENALYLAMDVRKEIDHIHIVDETIKWTGQLDCYINCAGFSKWRPVDEVDEPLWDQMIDTNLKGAFWGCKTAARYLSSNGSIINISSLAGKRGSANNSVYCASKFGMNGLTQALAKELGPRGIRVNAVCPVYVRTDGLIEALKDPQAPPRGQEIDRYFEDFIKQNTALQRLPQGKEVADLCFEYNEKKDNRCNSSSYGGFSFPRETPGKNS
jgi:NAD(P)-dependent dehydrogenase (short-subunit alcohol dehydrogenase family)